MLASRPEPPATISASWIQRTPTIRCSPKCSKVRTRCSRRLLASRRMRSETDCPRMPSHQASSTNTRGAPCLCFLGPVQ